MLFQTKRIRSGGELFPKANIFIIDELTLPIKEKPKYPDWYITLDKLERFVSLFGSHKDIVWSFCRNNKNKWVGDNYIQEVLINNSENYLITTSLELNKEKRVSLLICKDTTEEEYHQIRTLFEI